MDANLGLLFYRTCYQKGDDQTHIKQTIDKILKAKAKDEALKTPFGFELTTAYPGLLIGSGYAHGISSEEDIKIGFYFDHTSGLPVIPGSSVKGVLRSLFGLAFNSKNPDPYAETKASMIRQMLGKEELDIPALARAIFEGVDEKGKRLGIYHRDRFYDARIVATGRAGLISDDYITPHKDPLKNPVPIRFIKVSPGVTFRFAFDLVDTTVGGVTVSAEEKERLFYQLLADFGVGAKTNVGYGNFEPVDPESLAENRKAYEEKLRRDEIRRQAEASDNPADKIAAKAQTAKNAKALYGDLKQFAGITLGEEELQSIIAIITERFPSGDKFTKKAVNRLKRLDELSKEG
jgi:CRISPR-associated protein Cmr6